MDRIKWLTKKRLEILKQWKDNQISLEEAARALVDLGYSPESAHSILEST